MEIKVINCRYSCPFFGFEEKMMICKHPYWNDKRPYENLIIEHNDKIPEKCPLRKENLTIVYKLDKNENYIRRNKIKKRTYSY